MKKYTIGVTVKYGYDKLPLQKKQLQIVVEKIKHKKRVRFL